MRDRWRWPPVPGSRVHARRPDTPVRKKKRHSGPIRGSMSILGRESQRMATRGCYFASGEIDRALQLGAFIGDVTHEGTRFCGAESGAGTPVN